MERRWNDHDRLIEERRGDGMNRNFFFFVGHLFVRESS